MDWKFEIGALVQHKAAKAVDAKHAMVVVERNVQECHGGTQRHYSVRVATVGENPLGHWGVMKALSIVTGLVQFTEIELVKFDAGKPDTEED